MNMEKPKPAKISFIIVFERGLPRKGMGCGSRMEM
jgi:hypothetical protein